MPLNKENNIMSTITTTTTTTNTKASACTRNKYGELFFKCFMTLKPLTTKINVKIVRSRERER